MMIGFRLGLIGGGPMGPWTGFPLMNSLNSPCRLVELGRPVISSFIHRIRPKRPNTLPKALRRWLNCSTTPTIAKNELCVAMNVDSSICATPEKVWTMEWRRENVCWVVVSRVCEREILLGSIPGYMPIPPIPGIAGMAPYILFMPFMPYPP